MTHRIKVADPRLVNIPGIQQHYSRPPVPSASLTVSLALLLLLLRRCLRQHVVELLRREVGGCVAHWVRTPLS